MNIKDYYSSLNSTWLVLLTILITIIDFSMFALFYQTWKKGKELNTWSNFIGLGQPMLATIWIEFIVLLVLARFTNIMPIMGVVTTPPLVVSIDDSDFSWISFLVPYVMKCVAFGFQVIIERGSLILYDQYWGNIIAALIVLLVALLAIYLTIISISCVIKTIVYSKYIRKLYLRFFVFSLILCFFGWVPFLALASVLIPVIAVCLALCAVPLLAGVGRYGSVESSRRSTVEKWKTDEAFFRGDDIYYDPSTGAYVSVDSDGTLRDENGTPRKIIERSSTYLKDERGWIYRRSSGRYKNGHYQDLYDNDD